MSFLSVQIIVHTELNHESNYSKIIRLVRSIECKRNSFHAREIVITILFQRNNDIDQQEDGDDNYANDMSLSQNVDMDSQTRGTVRNLRIREDTANYLYNLDEKSAYYDPKSRSMRGNPLEVCFLVKNVQFYLSQD